MQSLQRVAEEFMKNPDDPMHEYLSIMLGSRIGEPHRLYILAENLSALSPLMAKDAEYLMYVDIERTDWPNGPPRGFFLTENGLYEPAKNICTSNGVYHPEKYVSMPLITQMYSMLLSMVMNDEMLHHGIGVIKYSPSRGGGISTASRESRKYNERHSAIISALREFAAEYRERFPRLPEGAEREEWARGKSQYIKLPQGMRADWPSRTVIIFGEVPSFPSLHSSWNTCKIIDGGKATPPPSMVVLDERSSELDALGL